jgi:hypothetical protein
VLVVACKERQAPITVAIPVALVVHKQLALQALASAEMAPLVAVPAVAVTGVEPEALAMQVAAAVLVGLQQIFNLLHTHVEKMPATVHSPLRLRKMQQSRRQQTLLQMVGTIEFMCHGRRQQIKKQRAIALGGVPRRVLSQK